MEQYPLEKRKRYTLFEYLMSYWNQMINISENTILGQPATEFLLKKNAHA